MEKLDAKDYEILKELDNDFRQSFSQIGKKVNLSKNSVSLRFDKLKEYMLHNLVGIDNELIGYTMVKVYYTFDFYNEDVERDIAGELKKHVYKNMMYAARYYGPYDLGICFLVNNIDDLIYQVTRFNEKFANKISQKEMQVIHKQFYFRYNFLHKEPIRKVFDIIKTDRKEEITKTDKKIINIIRNEPRMNIIDIARKAGLTPKTASKRIKELEEKKIITGYFMTLDVTKFNHATFKLLIQVRNMKNEPEFESYLKSIKNVRYIVKMVGLWDYELDFIYTNITELQNQIELIKEKFPNALKKMSIISFGKRILTNSENFLA